MEYMILLGFGVFTGITASLFGFGGGFIIVPLMSYLVSPNSSEYSMQIAVATSLAVMVVNSITTTFKHHKLGNILWQHIFPFVYYIAIGSILGSIAATFLSGTVVRWIFIIYVSYVIFKCSFFKGFINVATKVKTLTPLSKVWRGVGIGIIASALGVGGSVLTVPLMRRTGLTMKQSVALGNPLSLPVAIVATISYIILGIHSAIPLNSQYLGFVYWPAFLILSIAGFIGIPIGAYFADKIADKIHAKVYIFFLFLVLISMLYGGHR